MNVRMMTSALTTSRTNPEQETFIPAAPVFATTQVAASEFGCITLSDDFERALDHFATSIEDTIENQVNHRPAVQEWTDLHSVNSVNLCHSRLRAAFFYTLHKRA